MRSSHPDTETAMPDVTEIQGAEMPEVVTPPVSPHGARPLQTDSVQRRPEPLARLTSKQAHKLRRVRAKDATQVRLLREQCQKFYLSILNRDRDEQTSPRSLGFTGPDGGECRTTLALTTASILSNEMGMATTLLECNWVHPCLHKHFGLAQTPGLAEWVRQECDVLDIRHAVGSNLTVILAGNGR